MPKPLIVQYTPIRSCLVNLPHKWVNALLDQKKVNTKLFSCISTNTYIHLCTLLGTSKRYTRDLARQQEGLLWLVR